MIYEKFNKLKAALNKNGLLYTSTKIISNIINAFIKIEQIIIYEISINDTSFIDKHNQDLEFCVGTISDIDNLNVYEHDYNEDAKIFSIDRYNKGDTFVIGKKINEIVFYAWIMFNQMELAYMQYMPISNNRAYLYKVFVVKKYRSQGILKLAENYIYSLATKHKKNQCIISVKKTNIPMIKTRESLGYKKIGTLWHVKVFLITKVYLSKRLRIYLNSI